jgi:mycothiol synthase
MEPTLEEIKLDLPPGFTHRPARLGDLEAAVDVFNTWARRYLGVNDYESADLTTEWQHPGFNLETNTRVVLSPEGRLVAYLEVIDNRQPPVTIFLWGRIDPAYEGLGISTALYCWGEQRARQAIPRTPPEARVVLQFGALSTATHFKDLVEAQGLYLVRHFFQMKIDLDGQPFTPDWPDGIQVRTYHHPAEARDVFRAQYNAFRDHWGFIHEPEDAGFERWSHRRFSDTAFDPGLWFLAMDGDLLAGFSLCRSFAHDDPDTGFVMTLGVDRAWRKRGLGLALLQHSFNAFMRLGRRAATLYVDGDNLTGALRLYTKAGMVLHRKTDLYEKELRPGRNLSVQELETS